MELGASVASHEAAGLRRPTMASAGSLPIEERLVAPTGAVGEIEALRLEADFLQYRYHQLGQHHPQLRAPRAPGAHGAHGGSLGVAFSGGGVRAAAFHCGLLWALSSQGLLKDVQHLASVSGGAYTAASFATHVVKAAQTVPQAQELDTWYKDVAARTILRMQRNMNYLVRLGEGASDQDPEAVGRGCCPRFLDIPLFILTIASSIILSPTLILVNTVWPLVLCIEHELAATLRSAWCDPHHTAFNGALFFWTKRRVIFGCGVLGAGVVLALLARLGCCRPREGHYRKHLFRRSLQQIFVRGAICYSVYLVVPWVLLQMQNITWGTGVVIPDVTHGTGRELTLYHCWSYINRTLVDPPCVDYDKGGGSTWYQDGHNYLYLNNTWVSAQHLAPPSGADPSGATGYTTPMFLLINVIVLAAGLVGLLFGLSLLRWYLTVAGPIFSAFLVAQVAQWQIFGPLTAQPLVAPGVLTFSESNSSWAFHLCILGAVLTLPVYDLLIKLMHSYYRRSLQLAYFCEGQDIDFSATVECTYCPHLLLGACVNDYRRPEEEKLLCDFTISPLFMGCPRTGFFCTDSHMRLGYAISVSAAAPDTFMLTKFDVLPIRFLLSVLSLRLGDFVRLEPDGKVAMQVGSAVRRFEQVAVNTGALEDHAVQHGQTAQHLAQLVLDRAVVALPFIGCHLLLVLGKHLGGLGACAAYDVILQVGLAGFVVMLLMSFFAFASNLRWLMRSPLILQFQMMFMHRHQAVRPPPYVYLSDGGLIECLGVLLLLRRRMPLIICSDACEDKDVTLRALLDTIHLAREERLCSFYDVTDPRRDVQLAMSEVRDSQRPYLRLGIRYEATAGHAACDGELLYIRMRLAPGDAAAERPLLTKEELMQEPPRPAGSTFDRAASAAPNATPSAASAARAASAPRRQMDGLCCEGRLRRWFSRFPGRRFPDFGTGNQFLQPRHFANLCALGAEMSLPAVQYAAARLGEERGAAPGAAL